MRRSQKHLEIQIPENIFHTDVGLCADGRLNHDGNHLEYQEYQVSRFFKKTAEVGGSLFYLETVLSYFLG